MQKINTAILFAMMLFLVSCNSTGDKPVISGKLEKAAGLKLVLQEMDTREIHPVDSAVPGKDGTFGFNPVVTDGGFWLLKAPSGKIMVLLLNPGDRITLAGSAAGFPDKVTMTGPVDAMLLNTFFQSTRGHEREADSLETLLLDKQDSCGYYALTQKIDAAFRQIWDKQRLLEVEFINKHPGSLASLVVLNYAFGQSPVLSPEQDLSYYRETDSVLFSKYPGNKHVKFHHQRVQELEKAISSMQNAGRNH